MQLRPRYYFQGGDLLYLAVNCLVAVFSCLSQFLYSTCQGIFLASYYPVSRGKIVYQLSITAQQSVLELSGLEKHTVIISQSLCVRSSGTASLAPLLSVSPRCQPELMSLLTFQLERSFFQVHSVYRRLWDEGLSSSLAVGQRLLQVLLSNMATCVIQVCKPGRQLGKSASREKTQSFVT